MPRIRYIVTALGLFLLGTVPLHARAEITPVATVIPLNPFLTQQSRFTNVPYNIYPSGIDLTVIPMKEGNVKAGPFLLHPHLGIAENYTDNVLRTDKTFGGRTADWYTTYQPGLQIQLPVMGRHRIIMDYRAYVERYSRDSNLDVDDQTMSLNPVFDFPGGLTVKLLGELKDGHDYRGSATENIIQGVSTGSTINKFFNTEYGGELEFKSQSYVKAQFKSIRWQFTGPLAGSRDPNSMGDINTRNRQESYSSLALGGRVAQKTYLFVQGLFQREHYEVNKDLDSAIYTGALGVIWEGTAKSAGEFSVGWQTRNMDRASTRGSGASSGLYMNGGMQWKPQEQTHLNWNLYRRTSETVLANTLYYTATGTRLDMVHAVTRKWNVTAQVNYERDTYSDQIFGDGTRGARQDDYLTFGGGLWYQIQPWLGARLTYLYTERLSNVMSVQYNANQTMASIQAQF